MTLNRIQNKAHAIQEILKSFLISSGVQSDLVISLFFVVVFCVSFFFVVESESDTISVTLNWENINRN